MNKYMMSRQIRHLMEQRDNARWEASSAIALCTEAQHERNLAEAQLGAALQALKEARQTSPAEPLVPELVWNDGHADVETHRLYVCREEIRWQWLALGRSGADDGGSLADTEEAARSAAVEHARRYAATQVERWSAVLRALGGAR